MDIQIRPASRAHARLLTAIQIESFAEQVKQYDFPPPGYDSVNHQIRWMKQHHYFEILCGEEIIGGAIVRQIDKDTAYILRIFVRSDWQNRGVGSRTMALLERRFPRITKWQLDTPYLSFQNHHFYEKLGYRRIGQTPPEKNGFYCFLYEKRLPETEGK